MAADFEFYLLGFAVAFDACGYHHSSTHNYQPPMYLVLVWMMIFLGRLGREKERKKKKEKKHTRSILPSTDLDKLFDVVDFAGHCGRKAQGFQLRGGKLSG